MSEKRTIITPRTPPGILELLPKQQIAFNHFMNTLKCVYERYGFLPVETSVMENTSVLLTKEGGETEKQVYFIQSTGSIKQGYVPDLALRFDLTVPLARYVAEHEHKLNFPFRRYQMQKVYRGERPQKGRGREFYQCDIDVIGKDELSVSYDAEVLAIAYSILRELNFGAFLIQLNNRKVIKGLLEYHGIVESDPQKSVMHEIDRLDKIGAEQVIERLQSEDVQLDKDVATALVMGLSETRTNDQTLAYLDSLPNKSALFLEGIREYRTVYEGALKLGVDPDYIRLNLAIIRGLDYYTGTVCETIIVNNSSWGSICSGGRYENLAGHYTKSILPGVGMSIGASRLFEYLLEINHFDTENLYTTDVIIIQVEPEMLDDYYVLAAKLRAAGLNVELYLDPHKLGKQFKYADRAGIPFAIVMGGDEKSRHCALVKDLKSGAQSEINLDDLAAHLLGLRVI